MHRRLLLHPQKEQLLSGELQKKRGRPNGFLGVSKTPQIMVPKRQQTLNFHPSPSIQPRASRTRETEDDGAEELILDALIGETYGDDDVLQERMTYQDLPQCG
jgi:hypothetical protein